MSNRRTKLLSLAAVVVVAAVLYLTFAALRPRPQAVFRLREVHAYIMPYRPPPAVSGNHRVQAEFEYVGPQLTPRMGTFRGMLVPLGLVPPPPDVRWHVEDIFLFDEAGNELARLSPTRSTTRPSAHVGFADIPKKREFIHVWTFDLPPGVDPAKPVKFRTRLGVNEHPPVTIEVTLPPAAPTR